MAFTTHSYDDPDVLASGIRSRYEFHEVRSACAVMKAVSPEEWADITDVLGSFSFSANLLLRAGGNNSEMAETLNRALRERGWKECAYELETKGRITFRESGVPDEDLGTMSEASYWVDNRKGRVLVDIEWNAKDGNLDRDLAAYRAWHEAGLIDAAMIITKHREDLLDKAIELWAPHLGATIDEVYKATRKARKARTEEDRRLALPLDLTTTTVTSLTKAIDRINRGEAGTCPGCGGRYLGGNVGWHPVQGGIGAHSLLSCSEALNKSSSVLTVISSFMSSPISGCSVPSSPA